MKRLRAVFLDFDGVILESMDIKGWAFGKLFESYPQHVDTVVAYHHANGGLPRFDKIRHIYKEVLKEPLSEAKFEDLCYRYSKLVVERVLVCDFVPGALEFLKEYHRKFYLFVISATPQGEIRSIVEDKKLDIYFKGVFGSPRTKAYWTATVMDEHRLTSEEVLWVGDAISDLQAAENNQVPFIGRVTGKADIFSGRNILYRIKDLFGLSKIIKENYYRTGDA